MSSVQRGVVFVRVRSGDLCVCGIACRVLGSVVNLGFATSDTVRGVTCVMLLSVMLVFRVLGVYGRECGGLFSVLSGKDGCCAFSGCFVIIVSLFLRVPI